MPLKSNALLVTNVKDQINHQNNNLLMGGCNQDFCLLV